MDIRLLTEHSHQARELIEAISSDVREQQGAQENTLINSQSEYARECHNSHTRMTIVEERSQPKHGRM
eukprot:12906442-Prorocentrum_lima.AAC.1